MKTLKHILKHIELFFTRDDFIHPDTLQNRLECLTKELCNDMNADQRKLLESDRDELYYIWENYSKEHRKYRREWKKRKLAELK